jgi:hypothetical protein
MPEVQMDQSPKHVLLFSGHMIDAPGRKTPRFPADTERTAAAHDLKRAYVYFDPAVIR